MFHRTKLNFGLILNRRVLNRKIEKSLVPKGTPNKTKGRLKCKDEVKVLTKNGLKGGKKTLEVE